jgi:ribosomal protein L31E
MINDLDANQIDHQESRLICELLVLQSVPPPLRNLKESNPVELAKYAMANKLSEEAAFHWWVSFTLKKIDRIISAIKTRSHKHNQKFGIKIPQSVERALAIDQETNTSLWKDAIEKEMKHVLVAFDVLEDGAEEPRMSKCNPCHMIFDVKMDFTHNVHLQ